MTKKGGSTTRAPPPAAHIASQIALLGDSGKEQKRPRKARKKQNAATHEVVLEKIKKQRARKKETRVALNPKVSGSKKVEKLRDDVTQAQQRLIGLLKGIK